MEAAGEPTHEQYSPYSGQAAALLRGLNGSSRKQLAVLWYPAQPLWRAAIPYLGQSREVSNQLANAPSLILQGRPSQSHGFSRIFAPADAKANFSTPPCATTSSEMVEFDAVAVTFSFGSQDSLECLGRQTVGAGVSGRRATLVKMPIQGRRALPLSDLNGWSCRRHPSAWGGSKRHPADQQQMGKAVDSHGHAFSSLKKHWN